MQRSAKRLNAVCAIKTQRSSHREQLNGKVMQRPRVECRQISSGFPSTRLDCLFGAAALLSVRHDQRDSAKYRRRRQYQSQRHGFTQENDATDCRKYRNTQLYCRGTCRP